MLHQIRAALARISELFRPRSRFAAEQTEEFRFHIEMETAENVRRGMSEPEARRAAILRFGGQQRWTAETQDARGVVAVDNLARDARYALRRIRRAPAFAGGVIATLGIGLGVAVGHRHHRVRRPSSRSPVQQTQSARARRLPHRRAHHVG